MNASSRASRRKSTSRPEEEAPPSAGVPGDHRGGGVAAEPRDLGEQHPAAGSIRPVSSQRRRPPARAGPASTPRVSSSSWETSYLPSGRPRPPARCGPRAPSRSAWTGRGGHRALGIGFQNEGGDLRRVALAVPVDAAGALLDPDRGPRDVEVDELVALQVGIHALGGHIPVTGPSGSGRWYIHDLLRRSVRLPWRMRTWDSSHVPGPGGAWLPATGRGDALSEDDRAVRGLVATPMWAT